MFARSEVRIGDIESEEKKYWGSVGERLGLRISGSSQEREGDQASMLMGDVKRRNRGSIKDRRMWGRGPSEEWPSVAAVLR